MEKLLVKWIWHSRDWF